MERFWCYVIGFAIALVLVAGYFIVKNVLEDEMKKIAQDACKNHFEGVTQYVRDLTVEIIDRRMAEKEGEHEAAEL